MEIEKHKKHESDGVQRQKETLETEREKTVEVAWREKTGRC